MVGIIGVIIWSNNQTLQLQCGIHDQKPDCLEQVAMGINGQFPGPTISAQVGETIAIALTNTLPTRGTVIHWHGIRQIDTLGADGTAVISQCAINPRETFHYRF